MKTVDCGHEDKEKVFSIATKGLTINLCAACYFTILGLFMDEYNKLTKKEKAKFHQLRADWRKQE